jgi:hypothetical protein
VSSLYVVRERERERGRDEKIRHEVWTKLGKVLSGIADYGSCLATTAPSKFRLLRAHRLPNRPHHYTSFATFQLSYTVAIKYPQKKKEAQLRPAV